MLPDILMNDTMFSTTVQDLCVMLEKLFAIWVVVWTLSGY